jgi:hypothetical protein
MRKVGFLFLPFFMLTNMTIAQVQSRELRELSPQQLAALRGHLRLSDNIPISISDPSRVDADNPVKVFLAIGSDARLRGDFVRRISQWNMKNSSKYRLLEIVDDVNSANVLLVQISRRLERREGVPGSTIEERAGAPGTPHYPMQLPPQPQPTDFDMYTSAYVIARDVSKLEILLRVTYLDRTGPHPRAEASKILCDDFFKLVQKHWK